MDFFEAQDNARRKTKWLVLYYTLALILIIFGVYAAVTAGVYYYDKQQPRPERTAYWDTTRFILTAGITSAVILLGSVIRTLQLRGGGAKVAEMLGGEQVEASNRDPKLRQLHNVVEEMAIASGVPVPDVFVLPDESSINAFAAGYSIDDAAIAVSAGALENLNRDELQGVVAHEFSHILNGDMRLNIRLMGILFGIMMMTVFGRLLGLLMGGGRRARRGGAVVYMGSGARGGSRGGGRGGKGGGLVAAVFIVIILVTIIGYIGTFFGRLIQAAVSRQREYLADASAVQFTRNPEGIAGALKKIGGLETQSQVEHPDANEAAHLFFADALKRNISGVMSTHPPLEKRIRAIDSSFEAEIGSSGKEGEGERIYGAARGFAGESSGHSGKSGLKGKSISETVGTLQLENASRARAALDGLPDNLKSALRNPEEAKLIVLSLFLDTKEKLREQQLQALEGAFPQSEISVLKDWFKQTSAMNRSTRYILLSVCLNTLKKISRFELKDYARAIDILVEADQELTFYEFCLRRIVLGTMERKQKSANAASSSNVDYMRLDKTVVNAASQVLSAVCHAAEKNREDAERLFQKATQQHSLIALKLHYIRRDHLAMEELDEAVDILGRSSFAIRSQVVRAAEACITEDERVTVEEAELFRALAVSLGCPVPPVADD